MNPIIFATIFALIHVESNGRDDAVSRKGELGCLQISPAVVEDVNRFAGTRYSYDDRLNQQKSIEICRLYLEHYCSRERLKRDPDPRDYALCWHFGPKGHLRANEPEAKRYWAKVRAALTTQKENSAP